MELDRIAEKTAEHSYRFVMFGVGWFRSADQRSLYEGLFYLFLLSELVILFVSMRNSRKEGEKERNDGWSRLLITAGFCAVFWVAGASGSFRHTLPEAFYWIGIAFVLFGTLFRGWAVWTLGRWFTLSVQTGKKQSLVRSGPYRVLRHPAYTGGILQMIGFPMGLCSLPGLLFAAAAAALIYGYRIRIEERALRERFGEEYEAYSRHTRRLFPFLF